MIDVSLNTEAVDALIDDLYQTVVMHDIQGGRLMLVSTPTGEWPYEAWPFIGPPSEFSLQKFNILSWDYGWDIDSTP